MPITKKYRRKRHAVSMLHAHLVFCVKYPRRIITTRAFEILRRSMKRTSQAIGVDLVAVQADGDHLHVMICYPPGISLSEIVRRLKGASSRHLRQHRLPEVLKQLWGNAFWSPSFFVVSCGGAPLGVIKEYVDNQDNPHRKRRPKVQSDAIRKSAGPYPRTEVRGLRANL
ncbi:IS200/IS605 family transposase [Loktanella sp. DJP18]|uniref:IS200/IS605 family transposase n=1 Tax=Loktanella sp. DJP18 TaxID=3409788 RepID=UPI003BB5DF9B